MTQLPSPPTKSTMSLPEFSEIEKKLLPNANVFLPDLHACFGSSIITHDIFTPGSPRYIASTTSYYWASSEECPVAVIQPTIPEDVSVIVCQMS